MDSVLRQLRRVWGLGPWGHPLIVLLRVVRKSSSPFLYWDVIDIFETDLRLPLPESYAKEKFEIRIYQGDAGQAKATEDLRSLNRLPNEISRRFSRGDAVAIAYAVDKVVGCMWLTFSSGRELALGTRWIVNPAEALRYSSFVHPGLRGRALHSLLNDALNRYARERGILRTLGDIGVLNSQSRSLARHFRKRPVMSLIVFRVRGVNWTYRTAIGAPLQSRFVISPCGQPRSERHPTTRARLWKILRPVSQTTAASQKHDSR